LPQLLAGSRRFLMTRLNENTHQLFDSATNRDGSFASRHKVARLPSTTDAIYIVVSTTKGNDLQNPSRISDGNSVNRRRGVAAEELRRHNLSAVLDRLHHSGPLSRSELAERTGLNRSTIRDLIGELVRLGLVEEGPGIASTGPGRPSPVARARPDGAVVLALELTVDSVAARTVGLGGKVYDEIRVARHRRPSSPKETIEHAASLAAPLLAALPSGHRLVGAGIAVAGVVRRSDAFVHLAPNLGWRDVPLGEIAAEELGIERIMLANEADLGALGEYRRGAGRGVGHLIYVAGEVGIGTGIIINGTPMLGSAGYAGEAGHNMINPAGHRCRCGSIGCWETEAGEEALARRAGLPEGLVGQALLEELVARADRGDATTLEALDEIGRWLGIGIGNLINSFNPELIVIGGFHSELYPYLEDAVKRGAEESALDAPGRMARILPCELGVNAPLVGAAELVLEEVIASPADYGTTPALPDGVLSSGGTVASPANV
jgi:predicted NBD/HSP70 family sugar kinase